LSRFSQHLKQTLLQFTDVSFSLQHNRYLLASQDENTPSPFSWLILSEYFGLSFKGKSEFKNVAACISISKKKERQQKITPLHTPVS
jgi:hypothetical protein